MADLRWKDEQDQTRVSQYDPLTSLFKGKLDGNPKVDQALKEQGAVRGIVDAGQFYIQSADGRKTLTEPIAMRNTPDMTVAAVLGQDGESVLELDKASKARLEAIERGEQTVAENIGIERRQAAASDIAQSLWSMDKNRSVNQGLSR